MRHQLSPPASRPAQRRRRFRLLLPALLTIAALSSPLHAGNAAPAGLSDTSEAVSTGAVESVTATSDHVRFGMR